MKTGTAVEGIERDIERVLEGLNAAEAAKDAASGYALPSDKWHAKERTKFVALDCGTSGAFLIERATGEIFNIKAYGTPDKNKKAKADLGNIATVDPATLHAKRYNYLR